MGKRFSDARALKCIAAMCTGQFAVCPISSTSGSKIAFE
jgi:hypothetical protein